VKYWPLPGIEIEIPMPPHPGAFGVQRKFDIHTGVDLYCPENTLVVAIESGTIVGVENFTGPNADGIPSPWWNDTKAVLVEGESGVIVYGEISTHLQSGQSILAGQKIGKTQQVLKKDKGRPMCMLHLELYQHGIRETAWWINNESTLLPNNGRPFKLLDPTILLKELQ